MRQLHSLVRGPRRAALGLGMLALALASCDRTDLLEIIGQVRSGGGSAGQPGVTSIPFESFADSVGDKAASERRVLIRSRDAYVSYFGHAPPAAVDLAKEWVIFYAAGPQKTGGFKASLASLVLAPIAGETVLQAVTTLDAPGADCAVTPEPTTPYALVKFAAQPGIASIDFSRVDTTSACGGTTNPCAAALCPTGTTCVVLDSYPPMAKCEPIKTPPDDPCATVRCAAGTHCVAEQVQCVRAPCPPIAKCEPDAPAVHCGGIAGRPCPGQGVCSDDPSDGCDPKNGGADCGGLCSCPVNHAACAKGLTFNNDPAVCACVAPPGGVACGKKTCASDQICCSASCGICGSKGGACPAIACTTN